MTIQNAHIADVKKKEELKRKNTIDEQCERRKKCSAVSCITSQGNEFA